MLLEASPLEGPPPVAHPASTQAPMQVEKPGDPLERGSKCAEFRGQKGFIRPKPSMIPPRSHPRAHCAHLSPDDFQARVQALRAVGEKGSWKSPAAGRHLNVFP